ncbi:uncharacterized protein DUF2752 [Myroides indicus]|uniref:Uncharacterized protein DUF2752 n=2 Tax=Myroides indicus TaxID=1323422 RepID=A0A4R7EUV8_9FLAO|nr:uncharacterized protein DUF2752 [Myroides indicus]
MKRRVIRLFLWLLPVFFVFIYYYLFAKEGSVGLPCFFYNTTGWQCPGCGGQRAFYAIFKGEFLESIRYNSLIYFYLILLFYLYILIVEGYILKNEKILFKYGIPEWFGIFFLILMILFFLLRNLDKL